MATKYIELEGLKRYSSLLRNFIKTKTDALSASISSAQSTADTAQDSADLGIKNIYIEPTNTVTPNATTHYLTTLDSTSGNDDTKYVKLGLAATKTVATTVGPASGTGAATNDQLATALGVRWAITDAIGNISEAMHFIGLTTGTSTAAPTASSSGSGSSITYSYTSTTGAHTLKDGDVVFNANSGIEYVWTTTSSGSKGFEPLGNQTLIGQLQTDLNAEIKRATDAEKDLSDDLGDVSGLTTPTKGNLVAAVNSVNTKIDNLDVTSLTISSSDATNKKITIQAAIKQDDGKIAAITSDTDTVLWFTTDLPKSGNTIVTTYDTATYLNSANNSNVITGTASTTEAPKKISNAYSDIDAIFASDGNNILVW